jgi:hypothetical protein
MWSKKTASMLNPLRGPTPDKLYMCHKLAIGLSPGSIKCSIPKCGRVHKSFRKLSAPMVKNYSIIYRKLFYEFEMFNIYDSI